MPRYEQKCVIIYFNLSDLILFNQSEFKEKFKYIYIYTERVKQSFTLIKCEHRGIIHGSVNAAMLEIVKISTS